MTKAFRVAAFTIAFMVAGSTTQAAPWSWGLKAGPDFSEFSGDDVTGVEMKTGGMGGGFAERIWADQFSVRFEGLFVSKGFEVSSGSVVQSSTLTYLEFPVLFVANFAVSEGTSLNVFAGPTFGFNIADDLYDQFGEDVQAFEFGAAFGAGAEFDVSSFAIVVDARYTMGATSVFEDVDAKSRVIGIMAGVKFELGAGE